MSSPHKSGSPATTPSHPKDLIQTFMSRREPRALAASSIAIALSIGSAFSNILDAPSDGAAVQARDANWQTAYGVARMAVEMAKESSDLCLPLKAVLGAISVLTKNYDVSVSYSHTERPLIFYLVLLQQASDNVDKVKEIERRAQSLSGVLASPVGEDDYAEKGRRAELRGFVLTRTYISVC